MKIDNRQTLLAVVAASAVGLWVGDQFILEPLWGLWKSRSAALTDLRKKVADGNALIGRERGLRRRWETIRTNALPENLSLAEQQVLKSFDGWSQASETALVSIAPQLKQDDDLSTLECRVEAAGNLTAVTRFLYELENAPTAFRLTAVELSTRDAEGQEMTVGIQVSGLILPADKP